MAEETEVVKILKDRIESMEKEKETKWRFQETYSNYLLLGLICFIAGFGIGLWSGYVQGEQGMIEIMNAIGGI